MKKFMEFPLLVVEELSQNDMVLVKGGFFGTPEWPNNADGRCNGTNNYTGSCSGTNNASGRCEQTNNGSGVCNVSNDMNRCH